MKKELEKIVFDLENFKIINKNNLDRENIDFLEKIAKNIQKLFNYCDNILSKRQIIIIEKKNDNFINIIKIYNTEEKIYKYYNYLIESLENIITELISYDKNIKLFFKKRKLLLEKTI